MVELSEIEQALIIQHEMIGLADGAVQLVIRETTGGRNPGEPPSGTVEKKPIPLHPIVRSVSEFDIATSGGKYAAGDIKIDILDRSLSEASITIDTIRKARIEYEQTEMEIIDFRPIEVFKIGDRVLKWRLVARGIAK